VVQQATKDPLKQPKSFTLQARERITPDDIPRLAKALADRP
jgi:hypothetical protein